MLLLKQKVAINLKKGKEKQVDHRLRAQMLLAAKSCSIDVKVGAVIIDE